MARLIESLMLPGPVGRLEALLEEPDQGDPRAIALVCHPHPQQGGTMHNKVVYRMARGLRRSGSVVLRFNFRGVHLSQGAYAHGDGELEDARAALAWLRARHPGLPYTLAGFSFGSRVVLRLVCAVEGAARVIAAGFPVAYQNQVDLSACRIPKIFIQSTHDHFGSAGELAGFVAGLPDPKEVHLVEAADHFFTSGLDQLEETVRSLSR